MTLGSAPASSLFGGSSNLRLRLEVPRRPSAGAESAPTWRAARAWMSAMVERRPPRWVRDRTSGVRWLTLPSDERYSSSSSSRTPSSATWSSAWRASSSRSSSSSSSWRPMSWRAKGGTSSRSALVSSFSSELDPKSQPPRPRSSPSLGESAARSAASMMQSCNGDVGQ